MNRTKTHYYVWSLLIYANITNDLTNCQIAKCPNVEVLVLQNIGLKSLHNFPKTLSRLVYLDLSDNQLKHDDLCLDLLKGCPQLQVLRIAHNPVCLLSDFFEKVSKSLPFS